MMAKMGFKQGDALGKSENARKMPIQVNIKEDRSGIGVESEKKRKIREQFEEAERAAKRSKEEEVDYREMQRQQMKEQKIGRDLYNAQKTAERLHEKSTESKDTSGIPLQGVNVLWRAQVRLRLEKLREKKEKQHLSNILSSGLAEHADDDEDDDDRTALGRETTDYTVTDDLDNEDPELEEFEGLPLEERLQKVLRFLRETYHYCYWCGYQYPDAAMDGCPGLTEEDHD
jgi:hypothetical protein